MAVSWKSLTDKEKEKILDEYNNLKALVSEDKNNETLKGLISSIERIFGKSNLNKIEVFNWEDLTKANPKIKIDINVEGFEPGTSVNRAISLIQIAELINESYDGLIDYELDNVDELFQIYVTKENSIEIGPMITRDILVFKSEYLAKKFYEENKQLILKYFGLI